MRRFIANMLFVCLLLALAIAAAVIAGQQQSVPRRLAMLHFTDCPMPCWIGIVPGKTTLDEAKDRIKAVYGNLPGYSVNFRSSQIFNGETLQLETWEIALLQTQNTTSSYALSAALETQDSAIIQSITFDFDYPYPEASSAERMNWEDTAPSVAELQTLLGAPSNCLPRVALDGAWGFKFVYGNLKRGADILIIANQGRLDWSSHAYTLRLFDNAQAPSDEVAQYQPWRGFRSLGIYRGKAG